MRNNNNNNFNFNFNNFNFNDIKNMMPKDNHTYFFIIISVILLILIILIIRNFLKVKELRQKYIKNVFFREMDNLDNKPFDVSDSSGEFDICIGGTTKTSDGIPNTNLNVSSKYLLMFWVKLDSEKIHDYMDNNKNSSVDLVSFTNGNQVYPKYQMNILNNEMSIFVGDKLISNVYNLPYDEWFCISSYITDDHMDLYIDGKLVKIIEYNYTNTIFNDFKMKIGPYPGYIAYLQVNNLRDDQDNSYFNPSNIYEEYLVYKELIKKYVDNQYYKNYKITEIVNKNHSNTGYNSGLKKKNEPKENVCKSV